MSFSITFCGGTLLIMMGQQTRSESLFYYFRMEDHVPEDHLLRLVDRHIDFAFVHDVGGRIRVRPMSSAILRCVISGSHVYDSK